MEQLSRFCTEYDIGRLAQTCYQCGVCAGGCPVGRWDGDFNPRRIIDMLVRKELEPIVRNEKVWLCAACHTCLERCPQKIQVSEIMVQLKNAAARMGIAPRSQISATRELVSSGWVQSPRERTLRIRQELGLPELPAGIEPNELSTFSNGFSLPAKVLVARGEEPAVASASGQRRPAGRTQKVGD